MGPSAHVTVLAIPERAGVIVKGNAARNTGPDTVHVFTADEHRTHRAHDAWELAGR